MSTSPAIIAAENTKVAESKMNAKAVGWLRSRCPKGIQLGMCEPTRRSAPNSAAAMGMEPYDEPRISPFASSSAPAGTSNGMLASRAGRKNSEIDSWTNATA